MREELTTGERMEEEGKEDRGTVIEWEKGLPDTDELMPLTIDLIPPCLAAAFSISLEPPKSILDVTRAAENAFAKLRGGGAIPNLAREEEDGAGEEEEEEEIHGDRAENGKSKQIDWDESETAGAIASGKRPRLVWTPQLHKRFVDVVAHLGIKNSVPKTIMQLMNVEGLTRENVASHLQKYRLFLKRQGGSSAGESLPEHSTNSCSTDQSYHRINTPSFHHPVPMMLPMPMPIYTHVPPAHQYKFDGYHSGTSITDQFPPGYTG